MTTELGSLIIAAVQALFAAALVPACLDARAAVPRSSSVPTAIGLAVIAVVYASLGLVWAAIVAGGCAALWAFIAAFRAVKP